MIKKRLSFIVSSVIFFCLIIFISCGPSKNNLKINYANNVLTLADTSLVFKSALISVNDSVNVDIRHSVQSINIVEHLTEKHYADSVFIISLNVKIGPKNDTDVFGVYLFDLNIKKDSSFLVNRIII